MITRQIVLLVSFVFFILSLSSNAQKLPNIQEISLRAPADIKVDGKATEWSNQFQAYNKATEIFYTLSNDNDKLYLTVQATDLDVINKIICAGVTLTINGSGKMKDQGGRAITFPVLDRRQFPVNAPPIDLDNQYHMRADSFILVLNKALTSKAKDIQIAGISGIKDSLISIYNLEDVKAATLFDEKANLTYELSVPLKDLGISINANKPFVYNIKLRSLEGGGVQTADFNGPPNFKFSSAVQHQRRSTKTTQFAGDKINNTIKYSERLLSLVNPTDLSGEYTLKK